MQRNTIDFGIDLGTTNSEIAVIEGQDIHVFKNNENTENTASAVYIDRRSRLFVGRKAKDRAEEDPDNVRVEFKRDMGLEQSYAFADSAQRKSPEELSAEVLKSLKSDVAQRTGEEIGCAVITVPAMFELPACDATRRAAKLAGLDNCPLLQEPVAAAIAYGFSAQADNVFWLVYDFGGGTFDASLVAVRDGRISVVDHDGENHLGGKDFDWALLEEVVLPKLRAQFALSDFTRGNPKYRVALAKLKAVCERVKIELSRRPSAVLEILDLCEDERGEPVDVDIEISAAEYARCIEPGVARSVAICKRVLERNNLGSADDERLKDLAAQLDRADDWLEWPQLEARAEKELSYAREAVERAEDRSLEGQLRTLEREMQAALRARDKETVEARIKDSDEIWFQARQSDPNFWVGLLLFSKEKPRHLFADYSAAQRLFAQGDEALERGDISSLRRIVDQIYGLLPENEKAQGMSYGSGIS